VTAIVADVSFISLTLALPAVWLPRRGLAGGASQAAIRGRTAAVGKGGIVRKPAERKRLWKRSAASSKAGWTVIGEIASRFSAAATQEFLIGRAMGLSRDRASRRR
jgi:predicted rRNA methylase YqxC with S4 and FtsJ domains